MRIATVAISALAGLMMASPALALTVEANVSTELQEKFKDDFGLRESKILTEALTKKVTHIFEQKGVNADRVVVTIKDVKPSRPTMEQVSNKPGLDPMRSISLGGAQVTGIAYDASGKEIGSYEYKWFENSLENSVVATTWTDARTSFDRFARRFADKLQG
ncbi:MAG TPA: hypothetical protein PK080_17790 [Hyphomonadaceae bacterium]|nr:hypothetical protein [Hyphomonadaceae bacterium]